jgi:hypothetical protein
MTLEVRAEWRQATVMLRWVWFKLWFTNDARSSKSRSLPMFVAKTRVGASPRAPPATSLPSKPLQNINISKPPICNLPLSRFLGARPATGQQKRPPCSTQSLSYQRRGLWLASGYPQTSSANFPRHISCSPTSRAVLVQLSIKDKLRWRCD